MSDFVEPSMRLGAAAQAKAGAKYTAPIGQKHHSAQTMLNRLKRGRTRDRRKRPGPGKRGGMFV